MSQVIDQKDVLTEYTELTTHVAEILSASPLGRQLRLIALPPQLAMETDEVLVIRSHGNREVTLVPVKITNLEDNDIVFNTQIVDPLDQEFNEYAGDVRAASCLTRYDVRKNCQHIYD